MKRNTFFGFSLIVFILLIGILTNFASAQDLGGNIAEFPTLMFVYRMIEPTLTSDIVEATALKLFNLTGDALLYEGEYYLYSGNKTFQMNERTGAIWYADHSKLWDISYNPNLPSLNACRTVAEDFLIRNELLPKEAYFAGFGSTNATAWNLETENTKSKLLDTQVNYNFKLGDYSVEGAGAKITVSLGDGGEIIALNWAWREIEPYQTVQIIDFNALFGNVSSYSSFVPSMAYYVESADAQQDFLCPMYRVEGTVGSGNEECEFIKYVHASEFSPIVKITSPTATSSFGQGEEVFFNCTVSFGTAPYVFSWESDLDGVLGNSQTFNTSVLSPGIRDGVQIGNPVAVRVEDANGLSGENRINVSVEKGVWPPLWIIAVVCIVVIIIIVALLAKRGKSTLVVLSILVILCLFSACLISSGSYSNNMKKVNNPTWNVAFASVSDDGSREVGIEWLNYLQFEGEIFGVTITIVDLPNTDNEAKRFYNKLGSNGWTKSFNWGEEWAWEKDFKDSAIGGTDDIYVDTVDIAMFCGHGNANGLLFNTNYDDTFLDCSEARWGDGDLEWICLNACECLQWSDGVNDVFDRWGQAFNGVHMILGFHTICSDSASRGEKWAKYMLERESFGFYLPARRVKDAWFLACERTEGSDTWAAILYASKANDPWNPPLDDPSNDYLHGEGYVSSDPIPAKWLVWIAETC